MNMDKLISRESLSSSSPRLSFPSKSEINVANKNADSKAHMGKKEFSQVLLQTTGEASDMNPDGKEQIVVTPASKNAQALISTNDWEDISNDEQDESDPIFIKSSHAVDDLKLSPYITREQAKKRVEELGTVRAQREIDAFAAIIVHGNQYQKVQQLPKEMHLEKSASPTTKNEVGSPGPVRAKVDCSEDSMEDSGSGRDSASSFVSYKYWYENGKFCDNYSGLESTTESE